MNTFLDIFESNRKRLSDKAAVSDPAAGVAYSYAELDAYAGRIAAKLREQGVAPGDNVAIVLPQSVEYIAAMLGAMKLGAVFAPLNELYPKDRLAYIFKDCGAKAVVTPAFFQDIRNYKPIPENALLRPDDLAVIVYTSGSTGNPKGVMIDHLALHDAVMRILNATDSTENDVCGLGAPFFFIAGIQNALGGLVCGASNVIISMSAMRDPVQLSEFLKENGITTTFISPKILRYFKSSDPRLRLVFVGSERVSGIYSDDFRIFNAYGLSESCGGALGFMLDRSYDNTPVGRPLGGEAAYLLDEDGNEAEVGELCMAGNFARGYLNLPEDTVKTFVPNPFRDRDGYPVLLRTGDMARQLPDGNILYLNRKDWMVKINGQRVEPGEIEATLRKVPGIRDAAVKDFTNAQQSTYLAAYYTSDQEFASDALRLALKEKLPDYMIPAFFVRLETLPINANGKLDRNGLKEPDAHNYQAAYAAPETPVQETLCAAFSKILNIERVGLDDDFFALGGDSIKAVGLAGLIGDLDMTGTDLYEGKTVRKIAELIEARNGDASRRDMRKTLKKASAGAAGVTQYPLSPMERGMYLEQKIHPASISYNLNLGIRLRGVEAEIIRGAVSGLLLAHEALHSRYGDADGVPSRILTDAVPELTDGEALDWAAFEAMLDDPGAPFDLEAGVPLRLTLHPIHEGGFGLHIQIHHIAFDGGSAEIFTRELIARLKGGAVPASASDLYALYAGEQASNASEAEARLASAMEFYDAMFAGGVPVNEMPVKGPRPKEHPLTDTVLNAVLDGKEIAALEEKAKRFGITFFELLLSVSAATLGQYCASEDVVLGIPVNTRDAFSSDMIGMFVNTVPVRIRPVRGKSLFDYFTETGEAVRRATRECCVPFDALVSRFCKERDASRNPLFDMNVNYLPVSGSYRDGDFSLELTAPLQRMGRDVGLVMRRDAETLQIMLQYSSELFDADVMDNFLAQFREGLRLLAWTDVVNVRDLTVLPEEQARKLEAFSRSAQAEIPEPLLHRMFEKQAAASPEKCALVAHDRTLSFAELDREANAVAWGLAERGIGRNSRVVLLLPRRSYYFSALLGVLKSGAAFIPCDPRYPAERIRTIVEDSGAALILCAEGSDEKCSEFPEVKTLDAAQFVGQTRETAPEVASAPEDLAYLIYTSGSTGKPKGVMLRHIGISSFCTTHPANILYEIVRREVRAMLSVTTVSFDLSLKDTLGILVNGKTVVFADEDQMNNPRELVKLFAETGADAINATPSRLLQYLDYKPFAEALAKCRLVMAGGENYPKKLLDALQQLTSAHLVNTYGPTETTVSANMADLVHRTAISVGRPLLNYVEYIVDADGNPVPRGVAGELLIGGPGVAAGYQGLSELTEKRFINYRGVRVFRSGDYAKWDAEGNAVILGRADDQVKLRGLRIELGEIEAVLDRQPGITGCAAAVKTINGSEHLCAWYTSDEPLDEAALADSLKETLTQYMVPDVFMRVEAIPYTFNGKKAVNSLPEPRLAAVEPRTDAGAKPKLSAFETELMALTAEALGHSDFDITSNLMYAGLTSLTAVGLAMKLEENFHADIPIRELLEGLSVLDIEDRIYAAWKERGFETAAAASDAAAETGRFPLTSSQLGVYYDAMKRPHDILYNMPVCFLFEDIEAEKLAEAVKAAVAAHPFMNAHIELEDGRPVQVSGGAVAADVPVLEMDGAAFEDYAHSFVRPFDVHSGPLYRFEVVRTPKRVCLLWDTHHLIFDGMSRRLFMESLEQAYLGQKVKKETFSYFDFALKEQARKETPAYAEDGAFFDKLLSGFESVSEIPADLGGKAEDGRLSSVSVPVDGAAVRSFCRQGGLTPSTLFLGAVFYTVSRFANTKNVYISTISSGRNNSDTRRSIGMFVRTLPIAMDFNSYSDNTSAAFLKAAGDAMLESVMHESYPFTEIASKYGYAADIMYECQIGMTGELNRLAGHDFSVRPLTLEVPKFKIAIVAEEADGNMQITVRYNNSVYSAAFMETLARAVRTAAEHIMAAPEEPVRTLSLLDEAEEEKIAGFSRSVSAEIPVKLLHKVFETQADCFPERTALIAQDASLTYRELDSRANAVANALIARGVVRGSRIVLLLPRRSFYFPAMFGVLKAGGAFIPCDPEYPVERINHIVTDSGAPFVVTTAEHLQDYPPEKALDIRELLAFPDKGIPDAGVQPDDLAYLIYTSGSTGKPKGVMLRHGGICNYLYPHPANVHYDILKNEVHTLLSVTTVSFDMSLKETTGALCNGKTLVFVGEDAANDPRALAELFEKTGADCFNATPSRLMQLMEYGPFRDALKNCRLIMSGGEGYPMALRDRIREVTSAHIVNTYGPTEITVSSNAALLTNAEHVSVGRPLLNYIEYIVDADGNELPHGVVGELLVGGPGVAAGYNGLEELTDGKFITYKGQRVFRTGDFAKWDATGNVIILGRMDNQIKLRGLRIELGEIEEVLAAQPHIRQALAAVRKLNGQDNLCAYFTADMPMDIETLREGMKRSLTQYMIPTAWLQLDAFPTTPNGKLDRKALPEPVPVSAGGYEAPENETERYFCSLFAKTLGLEKVGANDDFFEIGGSSLKVMSVVIAAAEQGYSIVYADLFKYTTPRKLAFHFGERETQTDAALVDFADYDYTKINGLLQKNTLAAVRGGASRPLGNILLTGATGFMGAHVLAEYLRSEQGTAYCLVRKGKHPTAKARLKSTLYYYFESSVEKEFDARVEVFDGDVTSYDAFRKLEDLPIDTVFNCAANVKHFSSGTDIEDINVGGVRNCIRFCKARGARLIHFSTTSVAGVSINGVPDASRVLDEQSLYFGQKLDTKYTNSKLWSEREVLEAAAERGLDAKVIRVGTLAPRESDGEFQINFLTNNFMGRLRSYALLGCFPYSMMDNPVRMGPIDTSAKAFLTLAKTPKECCLFHAVNNHTVPLVDIIREMQRCGIRIDFVEDSDFAAVLSEAEQEPEKAAILSSMLAYKRLANVGKVVAIPEVSEYTAQVLLRQGFLWNCSGDAYIKGFIKALTGFGFFDPEMLIR